MTPDCAGRLGFETILPFLRPIEHLIHDDSVSEIMVNGSSRIFIERAGVLQEVPGLTLSEKSLMVAVKNIARRLGDDISEQKPILDSRLPDGSRIAALIPPCSIHGVTLTIRKFNSRHFSIEDLVRLGSLDAVDHTPGSLVAQALERRTHERGSLVSFIDRLAFRRNRRAVTLDALGELGKLVFNRVRGRLLFAQRRARKLRLGWFS